MKFCGFEIVISENLLFSFITLKQQLTIFLGLKSNRSNLVSVIIGFSIFIFGVYYNNTMEEYKTSTKTCENVATMKKCRSSFGIVLFNKSEVLIAGGDDDNLKQLTNGFYLTPIPKHLRTLQI